MDAISALEVGLGAEMLRAQLLGGPKPTLCARYRIDRFLGRGASGLVVAATDERLDRPVALKLSPTTGSDDGIQEARALARLDHPNVVRVYDAEVTTATIGEQIIQLRVIVMQRVEGRSLRVWLQEVPRTPSEVIAMFVSAGTGLTAAHAAKIIHRDFKPDNVIVRDDGIAQVIDFGFAAHAQSSKDSQLRALSDIAGTDPYLAPEARFGYASRRSDQFSFGIALAEALTGELAFPTESAPDGVDAASWSAIQRACSPESKQRFDSMDTLLSTLRGGPKPPRQRLVIAGAAAMVAVLLIARAWGSPNLVARVDDKQQADDLARCASLATSWDIRSSMVGKPQSWSVMRLKRVGTPSPAADASSGCAVSIEVERLCDSGQPRRYGDGFWLGRGQARIDLPASATPRLRVETVEIRKQNAPSTERFNAYSFDLQIAGDGARGTGSVTNTKGERSSMLNAEPVSRFLCLPGHDQRRPE